MLSSSAQLAGTLTISALCFLCTAQAATAEDVAALQLAALRTEILPCEPLPVALTLRNEGSVDLKVSEGWVNSIRMEAAAVGSDTWQPIGERSRARDDSEGMQIFAIPSGASVTAIECVQLSSGTQTAVLAPGSFLVRARLKRFVAAELISSPVSISVAQSDPAEAGALSALATAIHGCGMNDMVAAARPRLPNMAAFIEAFPGSRFSLYMRRSTIVFVRTRGGSASDRANAAGYEAYLRTNAPWLMETPP